MCYLVAKHIDRVGCIALKTNHGKQLVKFRHSIEDKVGYDKIQLITISRPSAYGEYAPYHIVDTEQEFTDSVLKLHPAMRD